MTTPDEEPPERAVVLDADGDAWQLVSGRWGCGWAVGDWSWEELQREYGPLRLIYTPDAESAAVDWSAITALHAAEIVDDFLSHDLHAECACGWVGENAPSTDAALADHGKHLYAMAYDLLPSPHHWPRQDTAVCDE